MITPNNIKKPNKHRAFRIKKKWFNRYERRAILMYGLRINNEISAYITDIRLIKNPQTGFISYNLTTSNRPNKIKSKPKFDPIKEYVEKKIIFLLSK